MQEHRGEESGRTDDLEELGQVAEVVGIGAVKSQSVQSDYRLCLQLPENAGDGTATATYL